MYQQWYDYYSLKFKPYLDLNSSGKKRGLLKNIHNRSQGFEIIVNELFSIKDKNFQIIETGTVRNPNNWKDGNSGFIFAELVRMFGGYVRSVDIDKTAVESANGFIPRSYFESFCSDSLIWLKSLDNKEDIDLFYLDSYDVKWLNDTASATHHLEEFKIIEPYLQNCIVAIDDNAYLENGKRTGKGRAIFEYLENKGINPIWDEYQIIYKFK